MWEEFKKIDPTVARADTTFVKLHKKERIMNFIKAHCVERHYMFSVKKCLSDECKVCTPPRLPIDVFKSLHHLPDPQPRGSDHYDDFESLYGTETSEVYRPSLQSKRIKGHDVPFSPSTQHAKKFRNCHKLH